MTYFGTRTVFDADSHLMESHGWLEQYADEKTRALLEAPGLAKAGRGAAAAIEAGQRRIEDSAATARLEADVMGSEKGWSAFGAMSSQERSAALDLLGIDAQIVFSTFAATQFLFSGDVDLAYGGAAAHNRGTVEFCADDPRLLAVGIVPLLDVDAARATAAEAIERGCAAIWVPHGTAGGHSPAHVDMDPFWATLSEAGVPVVLHVGGGKLLSSRFHDNGRPLPPDMLGGGENVRAKDFIAMHQAAETFVGCLVLDGVFERHPDLRCGVIELGASWVPGMLHRLDAARAQFRRNEPQLGELSLAPSDYVRRQIRFTPWTFDDVGALIEASDPSLYLFSTDYPHPEGTRDPLGKFEASLDAHGIDEDSRRAFYTENFESLFGPGNRRWIPRTVETTGVSR
ncbi:MAG: amidohydrolase [Acidimicrobiia bacterium]|nr:amidohydrolase [Acidimicrobiia bacterium]